MSSPEELKSPQPNQRKNSHAPSNDMRNVLDIQDETISFKNQCVEYGQYKVKKCKFIKGTLMYTPTECPKCLTPNSQYSLYRNGTQLSRSTLPMSAIYPTYLLLEKQRFMCKADGSTSKAKKPIVKVQCFIANNFKTEIRNIKSAN